MSVPRDQMAKTTVNQATGVFNTADGLLQLGLSKKLPWYAQVARCSPVRHLSTTTNIATSQASNWSDKASVALTTYAYVGQLPLLLGKSAARLAPGIGHMMLAKDAYGVMANIIDAGASNNIPLCAELSRKRLAMEDAVSTTLTQAWVAAKRS